MNIFKKLLKIGQAEIHAFVEKLENPIHLTEQGIQDMHQQLDEMTEAYAKARALVIRTENQIKKKQTEAMSYEDKAKRLLEMSQTAELSADQIEKLALEALRLKRDLLLETESLISELQLYKEKTKNIDNAIEVLQFNIAKWEKELTTLKAKEKLNAASAFANKQMMGINSDSTIEMLERLKAKSEEEEAISATYEEIAKKKIDRDINLALGHNDLSLKSELEEIKKQLKDK